MFGPRCGQLAACLSRVQFNFCQAAMTSLLVPPTSVRGKNTLDYKAFKVTIKNIPCVVLNTKSLNKYKKKLNSFFLKLPKFKPVLQISNEEKCIIYLDPKKIENSLDTVKKEMFEDENIKKVELKSYENWENETFQKTEINLSYENWPCNDVLRAILPEEVEVPTSYSLVGHILHLNLRNEQLPYKNVIGQIFLDKIPNVKTVVNKLDNIDNIYRNFAMETLAGEQNTIVLVKEHGCSYKFDFAKVYWNPRLSTEHSTLVNFFNSGDVLYDVFAGVGPFAVPAARKGVRVLANDLNPESHKWLLENARINKVTKLLLAYNKDGRNFLKDEVKKDILERREKNMPGSEHISMNLPALAVEFLDIFSSWANIQEAKKICSKPPTIHVYCFIKAAKNDDFRLLAKTLVNEKLGLELSLESLIKIHHVRNVAPNKEMMRVSFLLTEELLIREEPATKKLKLANSNNHHNFLGNNGEEQVKSKECV